MRNFDKFRAFCSVAVIVSVFKGRGKKRQITTIYVKFSILIFSDILWRFPTSCNVFRHLLTSFNILWRFPTFSDIFFRQVTTNSVKYFDQEFVTVRSVTKHSIPWKSKKNEREENEHHTKQRCYNSYLIPFLQLTTSTIYIIHSRVIINDVCLLLRKGHNLIILLF